MRRRRPLRVTVGLLAATALLTVVGSWAAAAQTVAFTISDARITESSGLARDTAANLYWTVNDSGDGGVAYGVNSRGAVVGTLNFRAAPVDVEAVAVYRNRLYVADIGDNAEQRDQVTVYFFDDPRANGLTVMYGAYDFRYPDGAHDAETLLVDEQGRLYVVTKGATGAVYAAPEEPTRTGTNALTRVGRAPAAVTDGVFLPGGTQLALLTYTGIEVLDAATYRTVSTAPIPEQGQPESLAVSLDGQSLLVGSEGRSSRVYAVPLPQGATTAPPTATADPTTSTTTAAEAPVEEVPSGASRTGTLLALGLAAAVAVTAGLVVGLARRPGR